MSTASSSQARNKRRKAVRGIYGNLGNTPIVDKETSIPKTVFVQTYIRQGKKVQEEGPLLSPFFFHIVVNSETEQSSIAIEKNQSFEEVIAATRKKIKASQVRGLWRKAINKSNSPVPEEKLQLLTKKLQRFIAADEQQSSSFESLLAQMRGGLNEPSDEAVDAVLKIQCTPIPNDNLSEAIELLVDFIKKHRSTNSQKILIAVGAAIRKVLLNLPSSDVEIAVDLIKSEGSLAVPIGVELEVAKMVVQRVVEDPSINALQFPELADAMLGNARLYSTAKMVNREFYNATALNSVLACLLMQHADSQSLCTEVVKCSPSWFSRLCSNRLKRIRTELMAKNDSNTQELVKHLTSLTLLADGDQKSLGGTGL